MASRKEVKVVRVSVGKGKITTEEVEEELTRLLNDGWEIEAAGGGTGKLAPDTIGFAILVREVRPSPTP